MKMTRKKARQFLKRTVKSWVKAYMKEAEHQDGKKYWRNFQPDSLGVDFALFAHDVCRSVADINTDDKLPPPAFQDPTEDDDSSEELAVATATDMVDVNA